MKRFSLALLVALIGLTPGCVRAQEPRGAAALGGLVAGLGTSARVLIVGAHPDDEDTRLIAWLARGRHVETAYLSLTRGDGGQNLIGNELGEALGVIRTEELLAARRIDGASQYFARAYDFGFSKNADEAFRHWPRDTLLGDVVRVVRAFRPHMIITIFSGTPRDGHGQHQVSGILGREAYDVAGDTVRFPTRTYGAAWTPLKFYRTRTYWGNQEATYRYNSGEYDPLLGRSYAEIASISRSQHKSQAQGSIPPRGVMIGSLKREGSRVNESTPAEQERGIFDGIDTTYARLRLPASCVGEQASLDSLPGAIAAVRRAYDVFVPERLAAPLATVRRLIGRQHGTRTIHGGQVPCSDAEVVQSLGSLARRAEAARVMASGLALEATTARDEVAIGDSTLVTVTFYNRSRSPVRVRYSGTGGGGVGPVEVIYSPTRRPAAELFDSLTTVAPDSSRRWTKWVLAPSGLSVSQPWWLEVPRHGDLFGLPASTVAEDRREDHAVAAVEVRLAGEDSVMSLTAPVVNRRADPVNGEVVRPLMVAPTISITLDRISEYAPANTAIDRNIRVSLHSASSQPRDVLVKLALPNGLTADSASRTVSLTAFGARSIDFRVRGRIPAGHHAIRATAASSGQTFSRGYVPIEYEHIRPQRLYRDAAIDVNAVDVVVPRGLTVAYLPGASDNSAPALQQLGVNVTVLDPAAIASADFSPYSTVVLGPRFFEAHPELRGANARLLDFARSGGTVVVQYGQQEMAEPGLMPFPVTYARPADRVTMEDAPVRVLDPTSPLLTTPNRITPADFAGWVQDRTLYMPRTFDEHYAAPLATNDPGEPSNAGAILVAQFGRGTYVYTTLAFFRQLPAGVPGAARLFVNLLSAKPEAGKKVEATP